MSPDQESHKDLRELLEQLNSPDKEIRKDASNALAEMAKSGDKRVIRPLIRLLQSHDYITRFNACEALGQAPDERSLKPLIAKLHDEKRWVRQSACVALGNIGNPRAIEPLLERLGDSFDKARNAAARSLDALGEGKLANAIHEKDIASLLSIAKKGDIRPVEVLVNLLRDADKAGQAKLKKEIVDAISTHKRIEDKLLCMEHFTRFVPHENTDVKILKKNRLTHYACRICDRTIFGLHGIKDVVAVLDSESTNDFERDGNTLKVNFNLFNHLFDFNKIEILKASDRDIEQFCILIHEDTDKFRKEKLNATTCTVSPEANLSDHAMNTLGEVLIKIM